MSDHDNIVKVQVSVQQMKRLLVALEGIAEELPKNPKVYAMMAEAPLEHIARMRDEVEQYLAELKELSEAPSP